MPKLEYYRKAHDDFTSAVSKNVRTLSITAVGIIWILKKQVGNQYELPQILFFPLLLIILALACDFFQYLYSSISWYFFVRNKEKNGIGEKDEIFANPLINLPNYISFYTKVVLIIFAYYYILKYFFTIILWK